LTENAGHEFDGREIGGQDILGLYRLKWITLQCRVPFFFETTAEHKSHQQSKLYNMHMYNMLECIKHYENTNLTLATGEE